MGPSERLIVSSILERLDPTFDEATRVARWARASDPGGVVGHSTSERAAPASLERASRPFRWPTPSAA